MYPTKLNDGKFADFCSHDSRVYHPTIRFHQWWPELSDDSIRAGIAKLNSRARLDSSNRPIANYRPTQR